jgi:integrase
MRDIKKTEYTHYPKDHGQIALYLRSSKKNAKWWARIKINGDPNFRTQSTYTSDFHNALIVATERYENLADKFRKTGSTQLRTFESVVNLWLSYIAEQGAKAQKIQEHRDRLFNYPVRLWGDKDIAQLKHSDLVDFIAWRRTNGRKKDRDGQPIVPTPSTIKRDIVPLRQVLKFAYNKEFISHPLSFDRIPVTVNPTPCFLEEEWLNLMSVLDDWILKVRESNQAHFRDRVYLKYYVLILGLTGIRPGTEAQSITWRSIKLDTVGGTQTLVVYLTKGKTGRRLVVTDTYLLSHIPVFKAFRIGELKKMGMKFDENEPIFCHKNGTPIKSFKKGFKAFLKAYDLLKDTFGDNRVPYSLRHTYATRMISFDIKLGDIAQNMGTSVKMLEATYLHRNHLQYGKAIANRQSKENMSTPFAGESLPTNLPVPVVSLKPSISPTIVPPDSK